MTGRTIAGALAVSIGMLFSPMTSAQSTETLAYEALGQALFVSHNCPSWTLDQGRVASYLMAAGVKELKPNKRVGEVIDALSKSPLERVCGELAPLIAEHTKMIHLK